jgi:metallo-beta-lactamase family protein
MSTRTSTELLHPSARVAHGSLTFLGGAGTVTGSKTLLEAGDRRVLVDCGLFQGLRELRRRNWDPLPVDADSIDAVVLTHAHLDHCGYLPALVKRGFHGPVFARPATLDLVGIILRDSAHLMEEDADHAGRHGYSKHAEPKALYTTADAERALSLLRPVPASTAVEVTPGVHATWRHAGHILGASSILLHDEVDDVSVLFSGDLGRNQHPLLRPPDPPPAADIIVVESTYGDRSHTATSPDELAEIISSTIARGGSVLIPAFAVDRTEVVLMMLRTLIREGRIPPVPVFVDSPMALRALEVYRGAIAAGDPDLRPEATADGDPFDPGTLRELHSVEESRSINVPRWPSIIISASGMATGGRVLHHLEHLLPNDRNTVLLVGYQAIGTRARDLGDGATAVKIHGRYIPVRARIAEVGDFSVHADADELLTWLGQCPSPPDACYVVHGESESAAVLRRRIEAELGWLAVVPAAGERVRCN